jgi:hypothetical protein
MRVDIRWISLMLLCLLCFSLPASAQTAASATLSAPQTEAFPLITVSLDIHNADGSFMHGLRAGDIQLFEDDQPVEIVQVEEARPGVQFVVVVNPGDSFDIRNSQGASRYDLLVEALSAWANARQASTVDDLSLVVSAAPESAHLASPAEWLERLKAYRYEAQAAANPTLDGLFRAVELAADPLPRPGMGRAVLFITPLLTGDLTFSLENLAARARQEEVRLFIWLVAPQGVESSPNVTRLSDLAAQSGGQLYVYSATEPPPDPESYLAPLRSIYQLTYKSQIKTSATHQLRAEVQHGEEKIATPARSFDFNLLPPDPAFISPPMAIERRLPADSRKTILDKIDPAELTPAVQPLEVLLDFPDGHPRPVVSTALYVDGQPVQENTAPPFERFTWDLSSYGETGEHILKVEVFDSYGLTGASVDTLVQVRVVRPPITALTMIAARGPLLTLAAILLSGLVLFLVLVLGGRIRPFPAGGLHRLRQSRQQRADPVTQPVPVKSETAPRRLPGWVNRLQWPQRRMAPRAHAFLHRLAETDQATTLPPISITAEEVTFGRDPHLATIVLDDPSVEALHARLVRQADGSYHLSDEGSVAGTWINYSPVSGGAALEHGDILHIGRSGFRFTVREPVRQRKPVVEEPVA